MTEQNKTEKTISEDEQKILDQIKKQKTQLREIRSKGTWKHFYKTVRNKTLELEKNKELKGEQKKEEFKKFFTEFVKEE